MGYSQYLEANLNRRLGRHCQDQSDASLVAVFQGTESRGHATSFVDLMMGVQLILRNSKIKYLDYYLPKDRVKI